jgi:hypothetical protein
LVSSRSREWSRSPPSCPTPAVLIEWGSTGPRHNHCCRGGEGCGRTSAGANRSTVVVSLLLRIDSWIHPVDFSMIGREVVWIVAVDRKTREGRKSSPHCGEFTLALKVHLLGSEPISDRGGKADPGDVHIKAVLNSARSRDISFAALWHCKCNRYIKTIEQLNQSQCLRRVRCVLIWSLAR